MKKLARFILVAIAVLGLAVALSACSEKETGGSEGLKQESNTQNAIEDNYAKSQPVPALTNSQVRENLIEIEEAIAEGVQTTSFFFNMGIQNPVSTCPSIGVPIPATDQLTNPDKIIKDNTGLNNGGGNLTVHQMDPTGIYTGDTTGTFVLCINAKGEAYVNYWEGFVMTEFGPAQWNDSKHQVELTGSASWEFSKHTPYSGTANNPNR